MYMIITDLFDIDIHIFTVIKFLFNLVVKFKYIYHSYIGIPLPNRAQLNGTNLWNNAQHRACVDVPKNKRDDRQNLAHKTFKTTTAYAKCHNLKVI